MPYKDRKKRKDYDRERKRIARAAGAKQEPRPSPVAPVPLTFKLTSAQEILEVLAQQARILAGSSDPSSVIGRAKVIGFLCSVALRAIEVGGLEARLDALEAQLRALAGPTEVRRDGGAVLLPLGS